MTERLFAFLAPATRLNMNDRMHWAKKAKLAAEWRTAAREAAKATGWSDIGPTAITVMFNVGSNRRRDPHNWAPTNKPIIDGMNDAGFWPDDTAQWVAVTDPVFVVVGNQSPDLDIVTVRLRPMGDLT